MTDLPIGSRVNVTLGERRVDVIVTDKNKDMLADGDLTNDLEKIRGTATHSNELSAADFQASGFDPSQVNLLANMGRGVRPFALNLHAIAGPNLLNFRQVLASKPYLAPNGQSPTDAALQQNLQAMPISGRNGVLAELSTETAMLGLRGEALQELQQPISATNHAKIADLIGMVRSPNMGLHLDQIPNALRALGGDTPDNRNTLRDAILKHPDFSLAEKHQLLSGLGITNIADRNTLIDAARDQAMTTIRQRAETIYRSIGGTGSMGETHAAATGDGTGTKGIAGLQNCAIAYMNYGDPTRATAQIGNSGATVGGINTQTLTFTPKDITRPVPIHISASGADMTGNSVTLTHGGASFTFDVQMLNNGTTQINPRAGQVLPAGVTYDRASQTITFPPGAEPIKVTQSSGGDSSNWDEIQINVTAFNAASETPDVSLDLNRLFQSDVFVPKLDDLPPEQLASIDRAIDYMKDHHEWTPTAGAEGRGPVGFDGNRTAEQPHYGASGSGTSADEYADLRSSRLDVDFPNGKIQVSSTTDPVVSNVRNKLGPKGQQALNTFLKAHPDLTQNDVLSGLRAFGIMEALQNRMQQRGATQSIVKPDSHVTIGNGVTMTYADFKAFTRH